MGMPVTVKGQVTIPKPIRDCLGLHPGDRVAFELDAEGKVTLRKAAEPPRPASDRFDRVIGSGSALMGMSTDEIMRLLGGDFEEL